jgi:carboxyl-terminal processing protease
MSSRLRALAILGIGLVGGACLSLGYSAWAARDARSMPTLARPTLAWPTLAWQDAQLFAEVYERIKQNYVEEISDRQLMEAAIRGAVGGLDPYSAYLDAKEFEEMRMNTAGEYSGVGIEVSTLAGALKVTAIIDASPAARANIQAGDVIVAVDNISVDANNLNETVERMRGKSGSRVKLTIQRAALAAPFDIVVTRGAVQVHSVIQETLEPGFGYVRISQFNENTAVDFSHALTKLQAQRPLRGLVLDLRNNPGGVLDAAVAVADALLDSGVIVTADGRTPDAKFAMQAHGGDLTNKAPIVVLVNGGSASASEIVAGALKDNGRATLVGQTTYGKGLVQSVLPLASGGALKLTTSRYFTPSGASIQQRGIVPDVVVGDLTKDTPPAPLTKATSAQLLLGDAEVRLALQKVKEKIKTAH